MRLYRLTIDILMFSIPIAVNYYTNTLGLTLIMLIYGLIHFKYPWLVILTKKLDIIKNKTNMIIW